MDGGSQVRWLEQSEQRAWRAFILGQTLLLERLDRELRTTHNISLTEYEVLVRLSEQPDQKLRMALLADAMRHSRSRVTHTISRMEKLGWVRRRAADGDGRGVDAIMTEAGHEKLREAAPTHVTGVREHLVDLASPEDFAAVGRVFDAVSDQLIVDHDRTADIR